MGPVKVKSDDPYIHWCPIKTNEYKFIFISFGTDEYNLNIFIDEFKNSDKEMSFCLVCNGKPSRKLLLGAVETSAWCQK
jgi:hypothetical protein